MKSGNHTKNPQWMYIGIHMLFFVIPNPFVFKWGIGGSWMKRLGGISASMPGFVLPVFLVWVPFAYQIEQWGHRQLKRIRVRYFGSGKTEWFFIVGILFAIPVCAAAFVLVWGSLAFVGMYAAGYEKEAYRALKWIGEHPKAFLAFVGCGKLGVILCQIVLKYRG